MSRDIKKSNNENRYQASNFPGGWLVKKNGIEVANFTTSSALNDARDYIQRCKKQDKIEQEPS